MTNINSKVYIVLFLIVLLCPVFLYPFVKDRLDLSNYENRSLMTWNDVKAQSTLRDFFPNLQTMIDDNILYKNESIKVIDCIDEYIFGDLFNSSVIIGKDNWLFYKGDGCIQDYRGGYEVLEETLERYTDAAENLQSVLNERGIELYLMITPNKETIYGEQYLPSKVKRISDYSRADQIVEYLANNTECDVVYTKNSLLDAAGDQQIWKKYDTHWNKIGAFIACQDFLKASKCDCATLDQVRIATNGRLTGDLANMLGMTERFFDDTDYIIEGYLENIDIEELEAIVQPNLSYTVLASNAKYDQTILFVGDSFLGYMEPYIGKNFSKCVFMHHDSYAILDEERLMDIAPDIVVIQTAERFISSYASWMNVYADLFKSNYNP